MNTIGLPMLLMTVATLGLVALPPSTSSPQSNPPVTAPSQDFIGSTPGAKVYRSPDGLLHMRALYIPQKPEVHLTSIYSPPSGAKKVSTVVKTAFWPTCVSALDNGVVLIAGKSRRSGATIIEVWTLTPPTLSAASTPGSAQTLVPGSIADINPVYSGDEPGKRLVRKALSHQGVPGGAILQFDDSRDLYALNTATAVMTPIASPDATRASSLGCTHAPLLSQTTQAMRGELVSGGYVYMFLFESNDAQAPSAHLFFDNDKNGSIDALQTLSTNQWTAAV